MLVCEKLGRPQNPVGIHCLLRQGAGNVGHWGGEKGVLKKPSLAAVGSPAPMTGVK